jgi:phosphomannomutase
MLQENALLGGEESGGYGFRGHLPERDGILAGLFLLDYITKTGKSPTQLLADLYKKVGPHYYDRMDVHLDNKTRQIALSKLSESELSSVARHRVIKIDRRDGYRYKLDDGSWLLIRFSGTEPLMRIYAESQSQEEVQNLLQFGQDLAGI